MTILAAVDVLFDAGHMVTAHALRKAGGSSSRPGRYTVRPLSLFFSRSMSEAELIEFAEWIASGRPDARDLTASPQRGQGKP